MRGRKGEERGRGRGRQEKVGKGRERKGCGGRVEKGVETGRGPLGTPTL